MTISQTSLATSIGAQQAGHIAATNTMHGAVNDLTTVFNGWQTTDEAVRQGEIVYRANDSASLSAAITAAPTGATILLSQGGTFSAAVLTNVNKDLAFVGDGPSVSVVDGGSNTYAFTVPGSGSGCRLTFRNIGFTGTTSAIFLLSRALTFSVTFIDCRFSGFTAVAIQTFGVNILCERCDFSTDGTPGTANAIQVLRGPNYIHIKDCTFRYLNRALYCTDTDGPAANVVVEGCLFDGGWMYLKSTASGSGGAVTYAATTVTDTGAAFGALTASSTVRAMASKQTGTITAISSTKITDSAANFTTAAVAKGDILRTSTGWGVVDEVVSSTIVKIEEWLSLTTYDALPAPATSTAYTIYGLVLGKVASNTGTVITVDAWRDWNGTIATPAAGTLYEVAPKSEYQCYIYRADKVRVNNNTIRRAWADSISAQLVRNAVITDNNIYDCQDTGITLGQPSGSTPGAVVANNRLSHLGSAGIWLGNVSDSEVVGNVIDEPNWMSLSSATYGAIQVEQCSRVDIAHNTIKRVNHPNALKAVHLYGTPGAIADISLNDNRTQGFATQDIMITGSNVTGVTGRFQRGTVITLVSSAVGPLGVFAGSGTPESVLPAAIGSTYQRTNGGTGTSWYVKESGTGATGWIASLTPPPPQIDVFTANGTWTKPAGAKLVYGVLIPGGTGGASGRRGAAGTVRCGGGGGGGGGSTTFNFDPADLTATVAVTIGAAGAGGAAVTADDTNGNAGTAGGATSFGAYAAVQPGSTSGGGTNASGTAGTAGTGTSLGSIGGAASTTGGTAGNAASGQAGGGGGGSGGGITSGNAASGGGFGIGPRNMPTQQPAGGAVDSTAPAQGTASSVKGMAGVGGGGGAASITTAAQAGAAGVGYGGGGGGGGASLNGNNSGTGGAGAPGYVLAITTF